MYNDTELTSSIPLELISTTTDPTTATSDNTTICA
ncbi:unnamed protein product, partial [Rotaria sordida]